VNDPIVDEVRRVRDAYAARFNYDLDAIFRDIKEQEQKSGRGLVSFAADSNDPLRNTATTELSSDANGDSQPSMDGSSPDRKQS
jgi:hypothetical protein